MEISITWNICRVCLREGQTSSKEDGISQQMRHLFGDEKLVRNIYELSGVSMKPNDSLPDKICNKCVSIINNAVQFRKTCRSSNIYLRSILERTKSASTYFKPGKSKRPSGDCDVEDGNTETKTSSDLENGVEEIKSENGGNVSKISENKKDDSSNIEDIENLEHLEAETEQENADNISDYSVEMEEIIEVSEEMEEQIFPHFVDDTDENLQNESDNCSDHNTLENSRTGKDIENENLASNGSNEDFENPDGEISSQDMQFDIIDGDVKIEADDMDESLILHFEEEINDDENQAQVSSTVDTNDEIKRYAHRSNISNATSDIEECLESEDFKKTSEGNSETGLHTNKTVIKLEPTRSDERKSPTIFSRRKADQNQFKFNNTANQICVCEICGNRFTNKNVMNLHMRVHSQHKSHECELCPKRFITACNLQAHMRIHTGEKPFECKYCHRRFNDRSSNLRHERTHTNEKPFECSDCGKTFTLATTLQNHMKVHTNERSFRCEPCGKSFKLAHHLKTHLNTSLHRYVLGITSNAS